MPRYIDADALIRLIEIDAVCNSGNFSKRDVILNVKASPTVDIVPRSEYDAVVSAVDNSTKEFLKLHDAYQKQKSEVNKLNYTLLGVMHSVDKWLEGEELEQDEVNRAITMREKTLQIIENTKTEVAREMFEEIESEIKEALNSNYRARPHIAESEELYHIVEGKIAALSGIEDFIAELKKKYIGE